MVTIGETVSHYRLLEELGHGGMGVVYRARDEHLPRDVAVKVLPAGLFSDETARSRFRREAQTLSQLNHPNIAMVLDFDCENGVDFLAMEFVEGETLDDKIAAGPLPEKEAIALGTQIAEALEDAHEHGIIHRDLKPANVMVTVKGRAKVLDFGLAKLLKPAQADAATASLAETQGAAVMGTVPYMAPEQLQGKPVDARADIYGLGTILYELATGQRPFPEKQSTPLIASILTEPPQPPRELNGQVSQRLEAIILKALEKNPDARYQTARELLEDLGRLASGHFVDQPNGLEHPPKLHLLRNWKILVLAAVLLVALAVGAALYLLSRSSAPRLTDKDTIVLSDFNNTTGDSVFDDTLKQGLSVQLEQSPFLALVSDRKVNDTLKLMGRSAGDRLSPDVTREVCQRVGSKAMVIGSIAGLGSQYVVGLKAVTCDTGDVLAEAQEQAASKEAVLKAVDTAAVSLRAKLGESLGSVQKYSTPLEKATTSSLEALKAYSLGIKASSGKGGTVSLPFFQRAVELDPNFGMAYAKVAVSYRNRGEVGLAAENARKAYELRDRVSELERFYIEANYYGNSMGQLEKLAPTLGLWLQTYPRDPTPHTWLGILSLVLGRREKAMEEFREVQRVDPTSVGSYLNLGLAYVDLDRLNEAEAVFKQAEDRKLESKDLLQLRYLSAFLKGDAARMARWASAAMGKPGAEDLLLATQADTEGWYGRLRSAHELTEQAMDLALHEGSKEKAAAYQAVEALREVETGNREKARAEAEAALELAPNRDVSDMATLALARAGDTSGAEKLAAELDKAYPLDTRVQRYWLPVIRAGVALGRKDPNRAIELLKAASNMELGIMVAGNESTVSLCPAYLRGEAYLMLRDGDRAAAEFQKFVDHRGVVMNFPWGVLARLGLARAYAMQGNTVKARAAYREFLPDRDAFVFLDLVPLVL